MGLPMNFPKINIVSVETISFLCECDSKVNLLRSLPIRFKLLNSFYVEILEPWMYCLKLLWTKYIWHKLQKSRDSAFLFITFLLSPRTVLFKSLTAPYLSGFGSGTFPNPRVLIQMRQFRLWEMLTSESPLAGSNGWQRIPKDLPFGVTLASNSKGWKMWDFPISL